MLGNTIGKNIRKIRIDKQLSQDTVAAQLHICRQTLSAYECGKTIPDIYILMDISQFYGISLDELTGNNYRTK